MTRLLLLSALAPALVLAGCDKSSDTPAKPTSAVHEAPRPETPPADPEVPSPNDTSAEPNEPPPPPPPPPSVDDGLESEVEPPSKAMARSAASAVLGPKLAALTPIASLGPTRFAAAWRVPDAKVAHAATAHLVVYEQSDGEGWTVLMHTPVLSMDTPWLEEDRPPSMPTTVMTGDYDDDGKAEVLVRIEEQIMCPGAGPNTITHLHLFNQGDALTPLHSSELHHRNDNGIATQGKTEHVDLNDDGHRDLRITYTTRDEHDGSKKVERNTWLWNEKSDAFVAEQVEYEASGCDW